MLLLSVDLGCSDEILTITALLSVENPFFRPKDKQAQADMKKAKFHQAEGDHLTLLTVYKGWEAAKFSNPWCFENFVQARSMKRAQDVRKQLVTIMDRYKLDIIGAGKNYKKICYFAYNISLLGCTYFLSPLYSIGHMMHHFL